MLDRIIMDIIHVRRKIMIVPDGMFPETPLPDGALAMSPARVRNAPSTTLRDRQRTREPRFDHADTSREIAVAR